ncbi:hypothetical protein Slin14017_G034500 [Septoria linicola]|nr:hypothetical protein Slin14017_G034500 [Septoria linicola]
MSPQRSVARLIRTTRTSPSSITSRPARRFFGEEHGPRHPYRDIPHPGDSIAKRSLGFVSSHWGSAAVGAAATIIAWHLYELLVADIRPNITVAQADKFAESRADLFRPAFREITPGPTDEVIRALREVAEQLAAWVPGGREYIQKCFDKMADIRRSHEMEVNNIARDTYEELRAVACKKGSSSLDRVNETWYILSRRMDQISRLAGDQAQQMLDRHPELREELNGSLDRLRLLGNHLGPGAKKQVDDTFDRMSELVKQGVDLTTGPQLKKLVDEKTRELAWRKEKAWQAAIEQLQPLLDRNPHVHAIFTQNLGILQQGRAKDVMEKVRQAVLSGSTGELDRYIKSLTQKSEEASSRCLSSWLTRKPEGSQILSHLQALKSVSEIKSPAAEQIVKVTLLDVSTLLERRAREAAKLEQTR